MDHEEVKVFAGKQFLSGDDTVSFEYKGISINNPWYDETGRFELTDEQAIAKYGMENIRKFCKKAEAHIAKQKNALSLE